MKIVSLNESPQIGSLVLIDKDFFATHRNDIQGGQYHMLFSNFQLGYVYGTRNSTMPQFNVLLFLNDGTDNLILDARGLKVLIRNTSNFDHVIDFIKRNPNFDFSNTTLVDSEEIYPLNTRMDHEFLNDSDIDELQQILPYAELLQHYIKSLLCLKSMEEKFNIIKNGNGTTSTGTIEIPISKTTKKLAEPLPRRTTSTISKRRTASGFNELIEEYSKESSVLEPSPHFSSAPIEIIR